MRLDAFRLYLAAFLAFDLASQVQSVAIAWQVYSLRHSAFDLGLVGLAIFTPVLVLSPLTGYAADHIDRRRIVFATAVLQILASLALIPLAGRHGTGAFAAVLALLVLIGVARAFRQPASMSLLPLLVPAEGYVRASSISSAIRQVAVIGGPALGGVLVAIGADVAYGTAIAAYVVGALGVLAIPIALRAPARRTFDWKAAFAGIAFLRGEPVVAGAITLDLFAVLFGGATALLPIYAAQIFHTGAVGFGMLRASVAVGTALMALVLARRPIHRHAGPRLLGSVAVFGAATVAFGLSRSLPVALVALAVLGAADMVSMAVRDALVALRTPDAMRGRVSALEGVFIVASNELGEFESGTLASFVGAVPAVVLGGAATIAVVALWTWRNAALRRADALLPAEPAL